MSMLLFFNITTVAVSLLAFGIDWLAPVYENLIVLVVLGYVLLLTHWLAYRKIPPVEFVLLGKRTNGWSQPWVR